VSTLTNDGVKKESLKLNQAKWYLVRVLPGSEDIVVGQVTSTAKVRGFSNFFKDFFYPKISITTKKIDSNGKEKQKDVTKKCWSYDFKNQYGIIMCGDTKIPTTSGKEQTLKKLPKCKNLKFGFYHVEITSDNDNFRKFFAFSKHNVYLKETLQIALEHAEEYDVTINLVQNDKTKVHLACCSVNAAKSMQYLVNVPRLHAAVPQAQWRRDMR
jgi:hypothetical protein